MEAILTLMPEEEVVKYSAMTGQSLFYMNNGDLKQGRISQLKRKISKGRENPTRRFPPRSRSGK